jgi:tetratricopeptide (TPR) repeat protein
MLMLLSAAVSPAADLQPGLAVGQSLYRQGDFKRAAAQFEHALRADPENAELYYWTGMAYQGRADLATPFSRRYQTKALAYLRTAADLAPGRLDYRRELFDYLLDSARTSPAALREAAALVERAPSDDPELSHMRWRLEGERRIASSREARFDRIFLAIPRAAYTGTHK